MHVQQGLFQAEERKRRRRKKKSVQDSCFDDLLRAAGSWALSLTSHSHMFFEKHLEKRNEGQGGPWPRAVAEPGVEAANDKRDKRKVLSLTSDHDRVKHRGAATSLGFYRPPLNPLGSFFLYIWKENE